MTDLAKLAEDLAIHANSLVFNGGKLYTVEIVQELREAAALLRAAAAADVHGLMAMVDTLVKDEVRASDCKRDAEEDAEESRAKLETALRVALVKGEK